MAGFESILSKKSSEVEKPKPLPAGTYLAIVSGPPKKGEIGKDKTDVFDYELKLLQPMDDVNQEELNAVGGLADKNIRGRFFLTEKAAYRLKEFCDACGVPEDEKSLGERAALCQGQQVKVLVKQEPSQDGTQMFSNAVSYSAA